VGATRAFVIESVAAKLMKVSGSELGLMNLRIAPREFRRRGCSQSSAIAEEMKWAG
jgi:hypothetical protein